MQKLGCLFFLCILCKNCEAFQADDWAARISWLQTSCKQGLLPNKKKVMLRMCRPGEAFHQKHELPWKFWRTPILLNVAIFFGSEVTVPPSRELRMICGCRETVGAPHMSRVPTAVTFLSGRNTQKTSTGLCSLMLMYFENNLTFKKYFGATRSWLSYPKTRQGLTDMFEEFWRC